MTRVLIVALLLLGACSTPQADEPGPVVGGDAQWVSLAPVPTPRSEVAAAAAKGKIYVVGGFAENRGTVKTVEVYRIATDDWKTGPRLPIALNHPMTASLGGKIYVFGGYEGPGLHDATHRAWVLHNGDWKRLPDMPAARAAGGAASARGKLFVVGGMKERSPAHQTLVFNPKTEKWKQISG
ncbi:MAG TPA: kelch repeat-containing protein, partial [Actinomycetota bacterium]|nr:kelch repeat-containing protein [Actinomycetota bacterium]